MNDKSNRKPAWTTPVVLGLLALLTGGVIRVLASGPALHPKESGGATVPGDVAGDEHNAAMPGGQSGSGGVGHGDGPDGTVLLGNPRCPVLGGAVDPAVGVAFNGWWISFCCPGCDQKFVADPAAYSLDLLEQTGRDVRQPPAVGKALPYAAGPAGTWRVGNEVCPVMGNPTNPDVGVAFNGWWISFCCPGCDKTFANDPSAYAGKLLDETGVDIRVSPKQQAEDAKSPWPAGPNATRDLGNTVCPVSNSPVDGDVGVEVNGWWVRVCSPVCASVFVSRLDHYAPRVIELVGVDVRFIEQTGHDVRKNPR